MADQLRRIRAGLAVLLALLAGAAAAEEPGREPTPKPASDWTVARNVAALREWPFADRDDQEAARRGLVAPFDGEITDAAGRTIWSLRAYDFLRAQASPATVNPALWRIAQLNLQAGLFEVVERIYQVRGLDLANMTIVEGDAGLIVIDPLTVVETARAALDLYYRHRPRKPVQAVIYTHSHADHFGGVRGVVDEAEVRAGRVQIIAPAGFMHEAVSENVLAGTAMFRRGQYQSGAPVARGERGQVDTGLGKSGPAGGTISLIPPTVLVREPYETHQVAGVEIEFQLTPGAEAPADMNLYLPRMRALGVADNVVHSMHNLLTPRGALVRDAKAWGRYLDDCLVRYGDRVDVLFPQHNWPVWGGERIRTMLADQRDMYTYLNDRTLHLLNSGLGPAEIAEAMRTLPGDLARRWYTGGFYGSSSFNARAVYQRYLGFYDANPASLDPLPRAETGRRYVEALGGSARVLELMRAAMGEGEYRWAVQLGSHLVFAEPANRQARELQADALEQLGYQTENALWRNMYLSGATELRHGVRAVPARSSGDLVKALEPGMFFDLLAVRLDADKALGHDMTLNWVFEDLQQSYALTLRHGVLTHRASHRHAVADATVTSSKATLDRIAMQQLDLDAAIRQGDVRIEGDSRRLPQLLGMLATFQPSFPLVAP